MWSNGATYTGQFFEGKYHGLGVYVWPSGKKFVGRWENGVKNGHGLYSWPNGKKYDGEYKQGLRDGYGRMTWSDGSNYCGHFRRNKRCGRGVQTGPDGQVLHCGEWKDDGPILDVNELPRGVPQNVTVENPLGQQVGQFSGEASPKRLFDGASEMGMSPSDENTEPVRDICSPKMFVEVDDDESCDLGGLVFGDETSFVKIMAPGRLVV